jgi:glycosyltransferase involved in cell wall biosynthesis
MKIGFSTSVIQRGKTGIAQHIFALLRAFLQLETEHRFVLFVFEDDLPLFEFAKERMELVTVSESVRPAVRNILWHQTTLPKLACAKGLDALHVPSYRRLLWPRPCPLVATIHDLAPFRVRQKYDWARMFYGRVVVKYLARRQDEIIAVSENTARDVREFFGISPQRLTVIHNGVEHSRFFPEDRNHAKADMEQRYGLSGQFFLYVARLEHPGKNHVRLVSAFNKFKAGTRSPWKLVLGGSDWSGAGMIHEAIQQSPFSKDIHCLGFVADEHLPLLYRAADTFVYPSLYEGFGMPPLEAMACGCPVISSTRGSLAEVIGDAAWTINPEDAGDMAKALAALASDSQKRNELRNAGIVRANCFTWQNAAIRMFQVYTRAVGQRACLAPRLARV